MIAKVNGALVELQGALLARSLYPAEHPRIRSGEKSAFSSLSAALDEQSEIALFCLDGRVIFNGEMLPACASLADTLFRMLRAHGVDQITFRRGLEENEVRHLLDHLTAGEEEGTEPMRASAHIGFSSLRSVAFDDSSPREAASSAVAYAEEAADVLPGIWRDLNRLYTFEATGEGQNSSSGAPDMSRLEKIVGSISRVVSQSADTMVPLAPLKRHDEYTFIHTINVAILSTALGEAIGLEAPVLEDLNVAALLHDAGKERVPKEILNRRGRFSEDERLVMQRHPVEGARMLMAMPGLPDLAPIVAYEHHIRADGSGYPKVPPEWKLNLASRIVQLADVFDALRTDRPYRRGLPVPKIVEMMRNDAGHFFDEDLLRAFFEAVVARGIPEPSAAPAIDEEADARERCSSAAEPTVLPNP